MLLSSVSRIIMQATTKISDFLPPNFIGLADLIERVRFDKVQRWETVRSDGLSVVTTVSLSLLQLQRKYFARVLKRSPRIVVDGN